MRTSLEETLQKTGIMVIDGSMGTALENLGCDLNDTLWTARALVESPQLVKQVHLDYFKAGADCGITDTYQATIPGMTERGYTKEEAEGAIVNAVRIFTEARDEWWNEEGRASGRAYPLCLGGIGPYGAYLANGAEYTGAYNISDEELYRFHRRRMELVWEAGADLLLLETQPSLREALIEAGIAEEMGADYWISFSCMDGAHINDGTSVSECAQALKEGYPHLKMVGVNCTHPRWIESLIKEWKSDTNLPIAVYPNSGEIYDAVTKTWHGNADGMSYKEYALRWMRAGAVAVGGCCQTVCKHIKEVAQAREEFLNGDEIVHMKI